VSLKAIRGLDYTVLLCANLPETKAFYRDVLGFPVDLDGEKWVEFRVGAAVLALRARSQGPLPFVDGDSVAGSASVQLAFRVPLSVLDACHEELAAKGATIVRGPTDLPGPRHRTVFFRDPEGNLLEIYAEY
jgi:lactoylglutathione lyase